MEVSGHDYLVLLMEQKPATEWRTHGKMQFTETLSGRLKCVLILLGWNLEKQTICNDIRKRRSLLTIVVAGGDQQVFSGGFGNVS
jgi:hypothetical protein